jgi:hypothetical protein
MKFQMFGDLEPVPMTAILKIESSGLAKVETKTEGKKNAKFTDSRPDSGNSAVGMRDTE